MFKLSTNLYVECAVRDADSCTSHTGYNAQRGVLSDTIRANDIYCAIHLPHGTTDATIIKKNKVWLHWARLVPGWVTVCGPVNHLCHTGRLNLAIRP